MVSVRLLVSVIGVIDAPEQMDCEEGVLTALGRGFTNTVAVTGVPGQPLDKAVMVNVTVTGVLPVLVSVPLILPVPLVAMPVTAVVLLRVQL